MSEELTNGLRAGVAQVDISPWRGVQLSGSKSLYRPTELIVDPLYAKALLLESGNRKICLISLDVPTAETGWATKFRDGIAKRFAFDRDAVMLHCSQTHAAPELGRRVPPDGPGITEEIDWLRGGDDAYSDYAAERIQEAIQRAEDSLEAVAVGVGSGLEGRVAFNRRAVMRDGRADAIRIAAGDPNILYLEGPIDPELGVVCLVSENAKAKAMLLHHTSHPCHLNGKRLVTAGWPGAWAKEVRWAHGGTCIPLVLNGCCGNIHHRNKLDPDFDHSDDYHRLGRMLAETTDDVVKNRLKFVENPVLDFRVRRLRLPRRELDPKDIEAARDLLRKHPEPIWLNEEKTSVDWAWCYAVSNLQLAEESAQNSEIEYELQVFRIGDTALVGLGGEPFVEGQLEIKLRSPAWRTFIGHMTNASTGYIPTPRAFERGGYETRTCTSSQLVPEALDRIVEGTVALLREVFGGEDETPRPRSEEPVTVEAETP